MIPEVDADTTASNAAGGATSEFGLPLDQALHLMTEVRASSRLRPRGVHVHIGSQIFDLSNFQDAVRTLASVGALDVYDIDGAASRRAGKIPRCPCRNDPCTPS
jgi:diaminopimelate decarboxylase